MIHIKFFFFSDEEDTDKPSVKRILTQFKSENGEVTSTPIDMPVNVTVDNLQALCNTLLKTVSTMWRV